MFGTSLVLLPSNFCCSFLCHMAGLTQNISLKKFILLNANKEQNRSANSRNRKKRNIPVISSKKLTDENLPHNHKSQSFIAYLIISKSYRVDKRKSQNFDIFPNTMNRIDHLELKYIMKSNSVIDSYRKKGEFCTLSKKH